MSSISVKLINRASKAHNLLSGDSSFESVGKLFGQVQKNIFT